MELPRTKQAIFISYWHGPHHLSHLTAWLFDKDLYIYNIGTIGQERKGWGRYLLEAALDLTGAERIFTGSTRIDGSEEFWLKMEDELGVRQRTRTFHTLQKSGIPELPDRNIVLADNQVVHDGPTGIPMIYNLDSLEEVLPDLPHRPQHHPIPKRDRKLNPATAIQAVR